LPDWRGERMETEMFIRHYDADMNLVLLRKRGRCDPAGRTWRHLRQ